MKVLMIGHSCSPNHGSEPGIAWNWAWEMSAYHNVWLIAHPEHRLTVEQYLREHPNPNLHIEWVELNPRIDPWVPEHGLQGILIHYVLWQRKAFRHAVRLQKMHDFQLVHHVSWITVSVPPKIWRLPIPSIWGPVGGGQVTPPAFYRYFKSTRLFQKLRTARLRFAPYYPALRSAVRRTDLVLATNPETRTVLEKAGAVNVPDLLDAGIPARTIPSTVSERSNHTGLTLLWAGHFEERKCLPLALEALAQVDELPIRLLVAGDGPLRKEWESLAQRLGVHDKVQFLGKISWPEMLSLYADADAFLFTSLNDSFGFVVLEAMAQGLPILTLDHQGAGNFVPTDAGIKVPVTYPEATVAALADGMRLLSRSPQIRKSMGLAAWHTAKTAAWDRKAAVMNEWYRDVVRANASCQQNNARKPVGLRRIFEFNRTRSAPRY